MKKLLIVLLILFTFGCAGLDNGNLTSRIDALEQEVNRLKIMGLAGEAAATDRIWPFYGLSSGTNALDGIAYANIGANDGAMGRDSNGYGYDYYWDATWPHASTCTSPSCVKPSDIPGATNGAWKTIEQFYVGAFVSSAADGEHFIDPSNSSAFPTGITEGSITCRDDRDACFTYDGSEWLPHYTGKNSPYIATGTIADADCWGGTVTNDGASGAIVLDLCTATKGMLVRIAYADLSGSITINKGSGDTIFQVANIVLDAAKESVTLFAINTSTWVVVADSGAPTYN